MPPTNAAGDRRRHVRRLLVLASAAAVVAGTSLPSSSAGVRVTDAPLVASQPKPPAAGAWFGAHVNPRYNKSQLESIHYFQSQLDRHLDVANKYHGFSDHNYKVEASLIASGTTPLISWRGTDNSNDSHRAAAIAKGNYDATITATANAIRGLNGGVLLRFNWEMDQPPGSRQHIGSPTEFVAAWKHIYKIFQAHGATNAAFVWAPRAGAWNKNVAESFYPGDAYVNWIGASSVPVGSWPSFTSIFSTFYKSTTSKHPGKPLLIWAGVRENPHDSSYKASWMNSVAKTLPQWPAVKAFVYYHAQSPLGYLFWADTSRQSFAAYKMDACLHYFHTSSRTGECSGA